MNSQFELWPDAVGRSRSTSQNGDVGSQVTSAALRETRKDMKTKVMAVAAIAALLAGCANDRGGANQQSGSTIGGSSQTSGGMGGSGSISTGGGLSGGSGGSTSGSLGSGTRAGGR